LRCFPVVTIALTSSPPGISTTAKLRAFLWVKAMSNNDSLAFAKLKKHFSIALEDAALIKSWGDGNCGAIIDEMIGQLTSLGLYDPGPVKSSAKNKKKIPTHLRVKVFERDSYRCVHCSGWIDLCADHIIPESKGGLTAFENLQTLCRSCNSKKGAKQ